MFYAVMIDGELFTVVQTEEKSLLISHLDQMVDAGEIGTYQLVSTYIDTIEEAFQRLSDSF